MELPRAQALAELQTVLAVYQLLEQGPKSFWEVVEKLDNIGLYPAALVAAAQVYNLDVLVEELAEFLYTQGEDFLNEMQGGIFESVDVNEAAESDSGIFYIYSKDPGYWDLA